MGQADNRPSARPYEQNSDSSREYPKKRPHAPHSAASNFSASTAGNNASEFVQVFARFGFCTFRQSREVFLQNRRRPPHSVSSCRYFLWHDCFLPDSSLEPTPSHYTIVRSFPPASAFWLMLVTITFPGHHVANREIGRRLNNSTTPWNSWRSTPNTTENNALHAASQLSWLARVP